MAVGEADRATALGLVVVEDPVADAVARRAVVPAAQRVARAHSSGDRRRLERARRRQRDADGPGQQGCSGRRVGERRVVGRGDAPGPDVRVVCRRARERRHRTRAGVEDDDRARVGGPAALAGRRHLGRQGLLGRGLHPGVERGDEVAAGHRLGAGDDPGHEAAGVDGHDGAAGGAAQDGVVLLLQPGAAHEVVGDEAGPGPHLLGAHLAEVAQDVGGTRAEGPRVDAHRPGLDGDAGEAVGLLDERQRPAWGRRPRRAAPAPGESRPSRPERQGHRPRRTATCGRGAGSAPSPSTARGVPDDRLGPVAVGRPGRALDASRRCWRGCRRGRGPWRRGCGRAGRARRACGCRGPPCRRRSPRARRAAPARAGPRAPRTPARRAAPPRGSAPGGCRHGGSHGR